MKIQNVPIYLLLMTTAIYMMFAKNTLVWNGVYFVSNYAIMTFLFLNIKEKYVRILGASLSSTILLFSILKFFISLDEFYLDIINIFTFLLIAFSLYKLEPK